MAAGYCIKQHSSKGSRRMKVNKGPSTSFSLLGCYEKMQSLRIEAVKEKASQGENFHAVEQLDIKLWLESC